MHDSYEALSPLDGRYHKMVGNLRDFFSESALIMQRVRVELEWLKFLLSSEEIAARVVKPEI